MTTTKITIRVTEEAAAFIEQTKLRLALEQMLEHAKQTIPGLLALAVVKEHSYEEDDDLGVTIEAHCDVSPAELGQLDGRWDQWKLDTFAPDVYRYFGMILFSEQIP